MAARQLEPEGEADRAQGRGRTSIHSLVAQLVGQRTVNAYR